MIDRVFVYSFFLPLSLCLSDSFLSTLRLGPCSASAQLGQALSIRPDVIGPAATDELGEKEKKCFIATTTATTTHYLSRSFVNLCHGTCLKGWNIRQGDVV